MSRARTSPIAAARTFISIKFPSFYDAAKARSNALRQQSLSEDAHHCLGPTNLHSGLATINSPTCRLAQQFLSYKNYLPVTHDPYDFASGLRYWQVDDDGTRMLFSAWIEYFVDRPEDLMLAPFGVQEMIENLQEADVSVQARALQVDCSASKPQTVSERKRSLDEYAQDSTNAESSIASSEAPYRKRARLFRASLGTPLPATSRGFTPTTYAQKFTNTSKLADNVLGNKGLGWSDARRHVWLRILCATSADLPATAFEGEIDELASHCTPTSADIRLCEFPMSIEEILTASGL